MSTAILAGALMYYMQVYYFYTPIKANGVDDVQMTSLVTGLPEPVLYDNFEAIDADSSPIRYRACFTTTMSNAMLSETYVPYEEADPLTAPKWFKCFDAKALGADLEAGRALAYLGQENIHYGIDRIVAITDDGHGYVWQQINACGKVVFAGEPAPENCPKPPHEY